MRAFESFHATHCSYLDICISRIIRLCLVDFEDKFQTNLQAKLLNSLVWNSNLLYSIFFYFLQDLSNPLLFEHCYCYSKELKYFIVIWSKNVTHIRMAATVCKKHWIWQLLQKIEKNEYNRSEFPDQKVKM